MNKYLRVKEISEYLNIPRRTVYHLIKLGKIKSIRIGNQIRCLKSDIEKYAQYGTDASLGLETLTKDVQHTGKRIYPRINSNFTCQYRVNLEPFKTIENSKGMIKNINAGGVLLLTQGGDIEKIDIDDPIYLEFTIASHHDQPTCIDATGRVIRKVHGKGIGIKFTNTSEETKSTIIKYVG